MDCEVQSCRHTGEGRCPVHLPAGIVIRLEPQNEPIPLGRSQSNENWAPAFAGVTVLRGEASAATSSDLRRCRFTYCWELPQPKRPPGEATPGGQAATPARAGTRAVDGNHAQVQPAFQACRARTGIRRQQCRALALIAPRALVRGHPTAVAIPRCAGPSSPRVASPVPVSPAVALPAAAPTIAAGVRPGTGPPVAVPVTPCSKSL